MGEVAAILGQVTGHKVTYVDVPDEMSRNAGYPGAADLANMCAPAPSCAAQALFLFHA